MTDYNSALPNCAPLITKEDDKDMVGWNSCVEGGCKGCLPCTPRMDTSCGQMMAAAGFSCAPPSCFSMCCSPNSPKSKSGDNTGSKLTSNSGLSMWVSKNKKKIGIVLAIIILIALGVYFMPKPHKGMYRNMRSMYRYGSCGM